MTFHIYSTLLEFYTEELRDVLEATERARKLAEGELHEAINILANHK